MNAHIFTDGQLDELEQSLLEEEDKMMKTCCLICGCRKEYHNRPELDHAWVDPEIAAKS
jgi:hypothetical protein